ncbi:MAG: hypothetical protein ACYDA3_13015 [Gaiellaceae bacterium]
MRDGSLPVCEHRDFPEVVRTVDALDTLAPKGEPPRNHFFEFAADDTRDEWEHVVGAL